MNTEQQTYLPFVEAPTEATYTTFGNGPFPVLPNTLCLLGDSDNPEPNTAIFMLKQLQELDFTNLVGVAKPNISVQLVNAGANGWTVDYKNDPRRCYVFMVNSYLYFGWVEELIAACNAKGVGFPYTLEVGHPAGDNAYAILPMFGAPPAQTTTIPLTSLQALVTQYNAQPGVAAVKLS